MNSCLIFLKIKEMGLMKFKNPLLVVKSIERSVEFYKNVMGLEITEDFGANVTLTGGV